MALLANTPSRLTALTYSPRDTVYRMPGSQSRRLGTASDPFKVSYRIYSVVSTPVSTNTRSFAIANSLIRLYRTGNSVLSGPSRRNSQFPLLLQQHAWMYLDILTHRSASLEVRCHSCVYVVDGHRYRPTSISIHVLGRKRRPSLVIPCITNIVLFPLSSIRMVNINPLATHSRIMNVPLILDEPLPTYYDFLLLLLGYRGTSLPYP